MVTDVVSLSLTAQYVIQRDKNIYIQLEKQRIEGGGSNEVVAQQGPLYKNRL